ncbi:IS66 family insertion sequence element accessory protein TnpB [Salipaludibacillus daqingensis]|uniref:IS66 family insertion sequence element accessory protein TnpB n=1 Tax=Salipaludibacillus daqingensis TaxID=3041001 RepID=UPI003CC842EF
MIHPYYERVYLACGPTDLRKSIDGLAVIVKEAFELDPFSPALFVFCNRNKDKLKILQWDNNDFWLYYKRLETSKLSWPGESSKQTKAISPRQLRWLLDGLGSLNIYKIYGRYRYVGLCKLNIQKLLNMCFHQKIYQFFLLFILFHQKF